MRWCGGSRARKDSWSARPAGAALAVSLRVAEEVDRAVIVMIFPDRGDRYLSEAFWNGGERWNQTVAGLEHRDDDRRARCCVPDDVLAAIRSTRRCGTTPMSVAAR